VTCKDESSLLGFYANVSELSKVPIEGSYRHVFGRRSRGDQAVHEMDLCSSIAIQRIQVNCRTINFDARAGNESTERRRDIPTCMLRILTLLEIPYVLIIPYFLLARPISGFLISFCSLNISFLNVCTVLIFVIAGLSIAP